MSDYQPKHRAEGPAVVGAAGPPEVTEPVLKHDTIKHLLKGSLGTGVAGCPRCEQIQGQPPFIRPATQPFSDRVNGARSSSTKDD